MPSYFCLLTHFVSIRAVFNLLLLDFPPSLSPLLRKEKKKKLTIPRNFIAAFMREGRAIRVTRAFMRAIFLLTY
jgi:hypothetical protein